MNLASVHPGDVVECDVRDARFYAVVVGREHRLLRVEPITSGITHYRVSARQVVAHFRRSARSRPRSLAATRDG